MSPPFFNFCSVLPIHGRMAESASGRSMRACRGGLVAKCPKGRAKGPQADDSNKPDEPQSGHELKGSGCKPEPAKNERAGEARSWAGEGVARSPMPKKARQGAKGFWQNVYIANTGLIRVTNYWVQVANLNPQRVSLHWWLACFLQFGIQRVSFLLQDCRLNKVEIK